MSFVSAVRDYVEILNSISSNITIKDWLLETFFYLLKTLQYSFLYIISFQWIRDFTLLPIIVPQITKSILKESFFLETPSNVFFDFLEIPNLNQDKLLLGFLNSFFLSLPISVTHIISIRRLLIQGIPAGIMSISGYICGQLLFLTCVIFGIRSVLIPWLTFEPLNYLIGLFLLFRIIYGMTRENLVELKDWNRPQVQQKFRNFFLTSFALAWCEQTSIFQFFGNLTLSPNPTIIESFSANNALSNFLNHTNYLIGIVVGTVFFTIFWGISILYLKKLIMGYFPVFQARFMQTVNKGSFVLAIAFCLSSTPFYGFDYLFTGPLGFVSQDQIFKNTILDQYNIKDAAKIGGLGFELQGQSLGIDVSAFDRGKYLIFPKDLSFEDLNYRGETEWISKADKRPTIADSKSGKLKLSKLFKQKRTVSSETETNLPSSTNLNPVLLESEKTFVDEKTNSRFLDWYDFQGQTSKGSEIQNSFQEFANFSFPTDFLIDDSALAKRDKNKSIEQKIKSKYYSNPIYKNLLSLDIDLLVNRQPTSFLLTGDQEFDLYNKRRILTYYTDSLRDYSKLPYIESFENFFEGSKSFTNKVYNQQFKGTLRPLRRLFSLTPISSSTDLTSQKSENENEQINDPQNKSKSKSQVRQVLKFDQPLYLLSSNDSFSSYHEELIPLNEKKTKDRSSLNPELISRPFYAGWDENLRKFVITNKLLPRDRAGYKIKIQPELNSNLTNKSDNKNKFLSSATLNFTKWPLSENIVKEPKNHATLSYTTLYEFKENSLIDVLKDAQKFETFPANLQTLNLDELKNRKESIPQKYLINIFDYLAPKRGGFIWPGNPESKSFFDFQLPF